MRTSTVWSLDLFEAMSAGPLVTSGARSRTGHARGHVLVIRQGGCGSYPAGTG